MSESARPCTEFADNTTSSARRGDAECLRHNPAWASRSAQLTNIAHREHPPIAYGIHAVNVGNAIPIQKVA